jgi:hypothetical protein
MIDILSENEFDFNKPEDKAFINDFNHIMNEMGYDFGVQIGSGFLKPKLYEKCNGKPFNSGIL